MWNQCEPIVTEYRKLRENDLKSLYKTYAEKTMIEKERE